MTSKPQVATLPWWTRVCPHFKLLIQNHQIPVRLITVDLPMDCDVQFSASAKRVSSCKYLLIHKSKGRDKQDLTNFLIFKLLNRLRKSLIFLDLEMEWSPKLVSFIHRNPQIKRMDVGMVLGNYVVQDYNTLDRRSHLEKDREFIEVDKNIERIILQQLANPTGSELQEWWWIKEEYFPLNNPYVTTKLRMIRDRSGPKKLYAVHRWKKLMLRIQSSHSLESFRLNFPGMTGLQCLKIIIPAEMLTAKSLNGLIPYLKWNLDELIKILKGTSTILRFQLLTSDYSLKIKHYSTTERLLQDLPRNFHTIIFNNDHVR
jgi:hypothetical protein